MCYMNSETQRGSDSENFGTRITRFGFVVEKIWSFEFAGGYFMNFSEARDHSEIIFQILGSFLQKLWIAGQFPRNRADSLQNS
jgi:hypothetical protein